jgi:hypothetical protein
MGRSCSTNGEDRNAYRILVGKPEGKRQLAGPGRRWLGSIKMVLRVWMNTIMNLRVS